MLSFILGQLLLLSLRSLHKENLRLGQELTASCVFSCFTSPVGLEVVSHLHGIDCATGLIISCVFPIAGL